MKFRACCSASSSVGAMTPACAPCSTARRAASAATTVLPEPTSPCTSRIIGMRAFEVGRDFEPDPGLRAGEPERQARESPVDEVRTSRQRPRTIEFRRLPQQPQAHLVRQQFLERKATLRRVAALLEQLQVRVGWRAVHVAQRCVEARQVEGVQHARRQQVRQCALRQQAKCEIREHAQAALLDAFRRRIDRRQRLGRRVAGIGGHATVLRMHDLRPARAHAHFAEAAQALPAHELRLLRGGEVKEPQGDVTRAVGEPHQQRAPAAEHDFDELDLAFDHGAVAAAQRCRSGLRGCGPRSAAAGGTTRPAPCAARVVASASASAGPTPRSAVTGRSASVSAFIAVSGDVGPGAAHRTRMPSTSTLAPRGRAATPTAARAG